jgi:ATP-binding cassette subfamily B protein
MQMASEKYSNAGLARRLMHEWRFYWPHMAGILLLSLLSTPLVLLAPLAMKIAVDSFIGSKPLPAFVEAMLPSAFLQSCNAALVVAVGLGLLVALCTQLQTLANTMLYNYTYEKLVLSLRTRLFPHVQHLSLSYHDEKGTSDSTYRILYDTAVIPAIPLSGIIPLVTAGFTLVAMLYVVFYLSWQLAFVALGVAPVLLLISRPFNRRLNDLWHKAKKLDSSALSSLQEVLSSVRVVKAFGKEESEQEKLTHIAEEGVWARIRVAYSKGAFDFFIGITTAISMALVISIGMLQVKSDTLTLGELLMVVSYLMQLYGPLQIIVSKVAELQSSFTSAERALELLDEVPAVREHANAKSIRRAEGDIVFENVSFAYDDDASVLENVSFEVGKNTHLGIVGETGSGKTTLISLLTRLYDPTQGRILLDRVDIRDYKLKDLGNQFAIVLQEPVLFSRSIAENISYARPDASQEEIEEAARQANAHEFIAALPDGYDTEVGERGMRLSGGERQRISIARAFLKNAPILILDEPTSSVDVKTEAVIMEAVDRLIQDRTTFIIAHRPSTLKICDHLLMVKNGSITKIKTPESTEATEALMLDDYQPATDEIGNENRCLQED